MAYDEVSQLRGTTDQIANYKGYPAQFVQNTETGKMGVMQGDTVGNIKYLANEEQLAPLATKAYADSILDTLVGSIPWYQRDKLFTVAKRSVTVHKGTQVSINGKFYVASSDKTISLPSVGNGKDAYIYACASPTKEPVFVISPNSTVPDGYNAQNSRKIGGFHTLCASVGTIANHALSGYSAGDILPTSVWDLIHRPVSEPEGMVFVDAINKWVQIYLPSWDGSKLVSRNGAVIVDGGSAHKCNGETFAYEAGLSKCRLISRDEFTIAMRGTPEGVNIQGSADPNTTGGHTATNGQRIISNYGIEDCAGVIWQWSRDITENYPGSTWAETNFYLSGYQWKDKSVRNPEYDPVARGSCLGLVRRFRLGAHWGAGALSGSRSVSCAAFSSDGFGAASSRLVSEPR